jgi:hypothetical protein
MAAASRSTLLVFLAEVHRPDVLRMPTVHGLLIDTAIEQSSGYM